MGKTVRDTLYSDEITISVDLEKRTLAEIADPSDDDVGLSGTYIYPTDPTFKRQMDIIEARAESIGSTLILSIKPRDLTKTWGPSYGFDHVTYQIFIDDSTKNGANFLPLQIMNSKIGIGITRYLQLDGSVVFTQRKGQRKINSGLKLVRLKSLSKMAG